MAASGDRPLTIAELLIDLAQRPELVRELEDAESREERVAILAREYPTLTLKARSMLIETNLRQIRLTVEADIAASDPQPYHITYVFITF